MPVYDVHTKMDAIPYENETEEYTQLTIANQRKLMVKDALNYGLKLKSQDQDIMTQTQQLRKKYGGARSQSQI